MKNPLCCDQCILRPVCTKCSKNPNVTVCNQFLNQKRESYYDVRNSFRYKLYQAATKIRR